MKRTTFLLIMILTFQGINAQKVINEFSAIDIKALQMPDSLSHTTSDIAHYVKANFRTENSKARAVFIWVASTIKYDIENMFAINYHEKPEEKVAKALRTKKGICENYAALFNEISLKCGLTCFVIEGYTKQNGFTDYVPHAWCAALVDSAWFLFDPTWGSGYVNNGKFFKRIDNAYFKVRPENFIASHMPFDPLWQFLIYPVTNQEFFERTTQVNNTKPFFNFRDSIRTYLEQNKMEQLSASFQRIEKNGVRNALIYDRLYHIKSEIEISRQNEAVSSYNSAVVDYNEALNYLNVFIQYRNRQFSPLKPDVQIQGMVDSSLNRLILAKRKLERIKTADGDTGSLVNTLLKSIDDAHTHVNEHQEFLKKYFSKGRSGRKSMFYKTTWFGIPLS